MTDSYVEELVERIRRRQEREADEHAYGPPSEEYPYDLATAGAMAGGSMFPEDPNNPMAAGGMNDLLGAANTGLQTLREGLGVTREQRPTTTLEGIVDMGDWARRKVLPMPQDRYNQGRERPVLRAAGEVLDAPIAPFAKFAKEFIAPPILQILQAAGVSPEVQEQVRELMGTAAEMALPGGAVGVSAKGTSAFTDLGRAAYAAEQGLTRGAKAAGRGLVRANEMLGEAGAIGKRQPFVAARGVEDQIVDMHTRTGGSTFNPRTGENMAGAKEYAVAILSDLPGRTLRVPGKNVSREQVAQFLAQNADVLDNPSTRVGTWFDEANNVTVFDIVVTTKDRATAKILGKKFDQQGVFDLSSIDPATGKPIRDGFISTGGKGADVLTLTHYSNKPGLTEIDPEFFGTGQAGKERARMTDPEFKKRSYFYVEGAKPEARFANAPHKYTVQVPREKILDINSPAGQALAERAKRNPTQFERLLRQEGYLGYTDSSDTASIPGAVALFEPQKVVDPKAAGMAARTRVRNVAGTEKRVAQLRAEYGKEAIGRFEMQRAAENQPWWYDTPKIQAKYGEDYEPMLDFIAVTSANRNVLVNVELAEKVHKWWVDAGRPRGAQLAGLDADRLARKVGLTGQEAQRVIWALSGDNAKITKHDLKLANFRRALRGDQDAVVLDLWMARAYSVGNVKRFQDPTFYETIADIVREEAAAIGVTPRQYQERVWVGLKYLTEHRMPPTLDDVVVASPAERRRLLGNLDRNPGPDSRYAVYLLGSLLLGDAAADATAQEN